MTEICSVRLNWPSVANGTLLIGLSSNMTAILRPPGFMLCCTRSKATSTTASTGIAGLARWSASIRSRWSNWAASRR